MSTDVANGTYREIELKLEAEPGSLDRVLAHPALQGREPRRLDLHAIYLDAPDQRLRRAGVSFRVRREGERWVQTVKAAGEIRGAAMDRAEWDAQVLGPEPDWAATQGTALDAFPEARDEVRPAFTLEVERRILRLEHLGADIELSLDQGFVRREGEPRVFAEVELELKRGDPAALFDLALALQDAAPLRLSFKTKADRGYDSLADEPLRRVKAAPVALRRGMTSAQGFQAVAAACLRHLLDNEPVLRAGRDAEAVHQMRVALRRLRAACTIFKAAVADEAFEAVRAELKWMAGELGAARDLDVFIGKVLDPARDREEPEIRALVEDYDARRARAYETAEGLIRSERFLKGVLRVAAWAEAGAWTARAGEEGSPAARPVRRLARDQLSRRRRRILKSARHLDRLDPEARHEVRIEIKKLRYAAEFFEGLFDKRGQQKRRRATLETLSELQDTLGDLNDIAVAEGQEGGESGSETLRVLQAGEAGRADALLARATEFYGEFAELEPFWE